METIGQMLEKAEREHDPRVALKMRPINGADSVQYITGGIFSIVDWKNYSNIT